MCPSQFNSRWCWVILMQYFQLVYLAFVPLVSFWGCLIFSCLILFRLSNFQTVLYSPSIWLNSELDSEGRSLISQHRIADDSVLSIINVYCPYGGEEGERTDFKINFYKLLKIRALALAGNESPMENFCFFVTVVMIDVSLNRKWVDTKQDNDYVFFN